MAISTTLRKLISICYINTISPILIPVVTKSSSDSADVEEIQTEHSREVIIKLDNGCEFSESIVSRRAYEFLHPRLGSKVFSDSAIHLDSSSVIITPFSGSDAIGRITSLALIAYTLSAEGGVIVLADTEVLDYWNDRGWFELEKITTFANKQGQILHSVLITKVHKSKIWFSSRVANADTVEYAIGLGDAGLAKLEAELRAEEDQLIRDIRSRTLELLKGLTDGLGSDDKASLGKKLGDTDTPPPPSVH